MIAAGAPAGLARWLLDALCGIIYVVLAVDL